MLLTNQMHPREMYMYGEGERWSPCQRFRNMDDV